MRLFFTRLFTFAKIALYYQNRRRYPIKYPLLLSLGFGFSTSKPITAEHVDKNNENLISKVDEFYKENKMQEIYDTLYEFRECDDANVLWRLARAARDIAYLTTTNKADKKKLSYFSYEVIQRALVIDPENSPACKWMGIILQDISKEYEGIKALIQNSLKIKEYFEAAVKYNPNDATSCFLVGQWCFYIAEMGWHERAFASAFFATPPVSSYEEALKWFKSAEDIDPDFYPENQLCLGKTLLRLGNKAEARHWLEKAAASKIVYDKDISAVEEAKRLLKSFK